MNTLPLLDADEREFCETMETDYNDQMFVQKHPQLARFQEIYWYVKYGLLYLYCLRFGHKLVDNGYATPDSGCIQMDCIRCGYSYPTHWLY